MPLPFWRYWQLSKRVSSSECGEAEAREPNERILAQTSSAFSESMMEEINLQ